jgi:hypothetical protein
METSNKHAAQAILAMIVELAKNVCSQPYLTSMEGL